MGKGLRVPTDLADIAARSHDRGAIAARPHQCIKNVQIPLVTENKFDYIVGYDIER